MTAVSLLRPIAPGSYAVVATISDLNYFGSASGTWLVLTTALVRHAPTLDGRLRRSRPGLCSPRTHVNDTARITVTS